MVCLAATHKRWDTQLYLLSHEHNTRCNTRTIINTEVKQTKLKHSANFLNMWSNKLFYTFYKWPFMSLHTRVTNVLNNQPLQQQINKIFTTLGKLKVKPTCSYSTANHNVLGLHKVKISYQTPLLKILLYAELPLGWGVHQCAPHLVITCKGANDPERQLSHSSPARGHTQALRGVHAVDGILVLDLNALALELEGSCDQAGVRRPELRGEEECRGQLKLLQLGCNSEAH